MQSNSREKAEKYYTRSLEDDGPAAQIAASRALYALEDKNKSEAISQAELALALAPGDSRILQINGKVATYQYETQSGGSDTGHLKRARKLFKKALVADPDNVAAHYDYALSYAQSGNKASAQALSSAEDSLIYYRGARFLEANMSLAVFLLDEGKPKYGRAHLSRAAALGRSRSARRYAQRMLDYYQED